jgi:hypothetical protein
MYLSNFHYALGKKKWAYRYFLFAYFLNPRNLFTFFWVHQRVHYKKKVEKTAKYLKGDNGIFLVTYPCGAPANSTL